MEESGASTTPEDPDPGSESRPKYEDFAHHQPVYSDWPPGSTAPPETTTSQNVEDWPRPTTAPAAEFQSTSPGITSPEAAVAAAVKKEKGRVRFNSTAGAHLRPPITPSVPQTGPERRSSPAPPRPSALRNHSSGSIPTSDYFAREAAAATAASKQEASSKFVDDASEKQISAAAAQERAKKVADKLQRGSPTPSRNSFESHPASVDGDAAPFPSDGSIPLQNMGHARSESGDDQWQLLQQLEEPPKNQNDEAYDLVRSHTMRRQEKTPDDVTVVDPEEQAATANHTMEVDDWNAGGYDGVVSVPTPKHYRGGVLSQLLKLYKPADASQPRRPGHHQRNISASSAGHTSGSESGHTTPSRRKWYEQNRSQDTLANLIEASARLANPNTGNSAGGVGSSSASPKKKRPKAKRVGSNSLFHHHQKEETRIAVHIAGILARQGYIIKLCRALMLYGAPTHRLEEYLSMSARVLEIEGQFLYLPGCMVISFDDTSTHTTEVRIVRTIQGIDLGKLKDVHQVYKEVMHDVIGVEEGTERIEAIIAAREKFHPWTRVLIFGLTSATAAPFSFKARFIDLPLAFCFGCLVGALQLIVAPKSNMYSNVFEVSATVIVSFMGRAFGSISNSNLFCFSAITQGGIVMLLPGYSVLCSALELQARAIVPGSIRIVYAIIYSLLLGFGITVGASLWGIFDKNATSKAQCADPMSPYVAFTFVPLFIICISILYQAKWRQMPVMVVIAFSGYIVNYFSSVRFVASPQIANTLGALCVGVLANLYSRIRHGVAAATLIPAIFVQVPGGLAATGGLLSGLRTADMLTNSNSTETPTETTQAMSTVVFDVAASMIQIAIGIAVGLFLSALLIYPLGKRRSGLFSF
ncbi:DUF1212 domain membrane protein Prm10 [Akanthomyces lecanii RCEF 1005]|uniref:DUF1212 domain membrane protein Prm10 n=1 Tax=Akanthomyces lecanii RCEF 1005 TaxID=1081108 RepID=A0A168HR20_CORDF|nr:DUF1212 domain membrane protein Prm10 [Akanthomyces lecanii RCEF 1005]